MTTIASDDNNVGSDYKLWRLDTRQRTLLLAASADQVPQLVWFGNPLPSDIAPADLASITAAALPPATLDSPRALTLFPQSGYGDAANAALRGHRQGHHFASQLTLQGVDQQTTAVTFTLLDETAGLQVEIAIALDSSGIASFTSSVCNLHHEPYQLDWLASATLPLSANQQELLSLHGRWGLEMQTTRRQLQHGRIQIENLTGRTSHEHFPGLICGPVGFNETSGQLIGAHQAWSGNHCSIAEPLASGLSYLQFGVPLLPGEIELQLNQTWHSPTVHVAVSEGLNEFSRQFHTFTRTNILPAWTRTTRPVHANSWEAVYFDHQTDTLMALIKAAQLAGAERFVLDDGWFNGRRDDSAGLGDWYVDKSVYPHGLQPVADQVRSLGMQFGLWFEPEMVNPDSDLYRQHPEWALHVDNYETPLARSQLVLNIALPEVQNYLFERITALVDEYRIDYIKWDMNRNLVLPGDGSKAHCEAQPRACYALIDRICERFPDLEIESCSSGGARTDLAILKRTGRIWTSDSIDAVDRMTIQYGFSLFFPPEIMGSHVGSDRAHLTGRHCNLHTRAIVALQGQYGFEFDARKINSDDLKLLNHYTRLYKEHRHWLVNATQWRIDSPVLFISGLVCTSQERALWTVCKSVSSRASADGALIMTGLDPDSLYTVSLCSNNLSDLESFCRVLPHWMYHETPVSGDILMKIGLQLPIMPAQSALLIGCFKVKST